MYAFPAWSLLTSDRLMDFFLITDLVVCAGYPFSFSIYLYNINIQLCTNVNYLISFIVYIARAVLLLTVLADVGPFLKVN